jgi:chitinase
MVLIVGVVSRISTFPCTYNSTVDWEYPDVGQQSLDYIQLLATLRSYLPAPRYLLTTALPAGQWLLGRINLFEAAQYLDSLNLMAYDFCGDWEPRISGHQAQLYAPSGGTYSQCAVTYVISQGFPTSKVLLGCPAYGWSFLQSAGINQPSRTCGGNGGTFDFKDLPRPGTEEHIDEGAVAAFCTGGDGGFVSYDNPETVRRKAQFAKESGLAGLFFWHGTADAQGSRSLVYSSYTALHS